MVRRTVERLLLQARFNVVVAQDVQEALRHAKEVPVDAALVDFELPDADGLQVLSHLRDIQPGCLRILMTGQQDYRMVVDAVNRGEVLRVLPKPFEGERLLDTLKEAFESATRMASFTRAQTAAVEFEERRVLGECLELNQLRLALQPIVHSLHTGHTMAYEALLRPMHPQISGPLALLRLASRYERLRELGACVFELAAQRLQELPEDVQLFVNLSPEQLADPETLISDIAPLCPFASRVALETTEQVRLTSVRQWRQSVQALREHGFRLAVDDVGAGYNSLAVLAEVQPSFIKVDMSLVRDLHLHPHRQRVVELVVQLAEATQAQVVGEGVECAEEEEALRAAGVHLLQGYFFGRPMLELPSSSHVAA
jgi:EAL domain-containing protein (putative c-di-GMP-specific phosphodiesterase class I)